METAFSSLHLSSSECSQWTEGQAHRIRDFETGDDTLFIDMMYALSRFGKRRSEIDSELRLFGLDLSEHYGTDASLFELGCYLCFRIKEWLIVNKPNLKDKISRSLISGFISLFSAALGDENLHETFLKRAEKYAELAHTGQEFDRYHTYLSRLIIKTKNCSSPAMCNYELGHFSLNFFYDCAIKYELYVWEAAMMPDLLAALKKYCTAAELDEQSENFMRRQKLLRNK